MRIERKEAVKAERNMIETRVCTFRLVSQLRRVFVVEHELVTVMRTRRSTGARESERRAAGAPTGAEVRSVLNVFPTGSLQPDALV